MSAKKFILFPLCFLAFLFFKPLTVGAQTPLNPINWRTNRVWLQADDFYIIANNKSFRPTLEHFFIYSEEESNSWTTLTAAWVENGIDMRINIYISVNENDWWSNEIETYSGRMSSETIYYTNLKEGFFRTRHGETFTAANFILNSDNNNHYRGNIYFKNLRLQIFINNPVPMPSVSPLSPLGEQKTLVIMYNFQDDPNNKPFSREEVDSAIFNENIKGSLNHYYKEVSFNKTWFTGEIAGWFTVPYNTTCSIDDAFGLKQYLKNKTREIGIDVENYHRYIYITPHIPTPCSSTGSFDGNPSETYLHGYLGSELIIHEVGHNLGMGHADSLSCGSKSIDLYNNCQLKYYGDPYDSMGQMAQNRHVNAFFKSVLGWVPELRTENIFTSGVYKIYPLETEGSGSQVLKILKPDTNEYYYLEYRQPIGYDNPMYHIITEGILIHIGYFTPQFRYINGSVINHIDSYLLDMTPGTIEDFYDGALSDGASFVDEINNITVTQLSHNENYVTISITGCPRESLGNINCDFQTLVNETDLTILLSRWGEANLPTLETLLSNWKTGI